MTLLKSQMRCLTLGGESKYLDHVRFEFGLNGHFLSSPLFGCQPHNSLQYQWGNMHNLDVARMDILWD